MTTHSDSAIKDAPRVFLFGFERSGTTLLSMMVGAHPRIAVPLSLTGLWYRYANELPRYNHLRTPGDVARLVDDLLHEERIRMWDAPLNRADLLERLEIGSFAAVVARFHSLYARAKGKDLWGNIDIDTLDEMDTATQWFPACKFIHIVRDGRDVALSHKTYAFGASNIGECAIKWQHSVKTNLKMGNILGPERYYVIRYEDLISDPQSTLRGICAFLSIPYSQDMLTYRQMIADKVPESRRWLWPLLDQPLQQSNAQRWKHEMSSTERIVFERTAGALLQHLGYEAYSSIPRSLSAHAAELYYFLGQGHRFSRLAEQLGLRRKR